MNAVDILFTICSHISSCRKSRFSSILQGVINSLQLEIGFLGSVRVRNTADLHVGGIPNSCHFEYNTNSI